MQACQHVHVAVRAHNETEYGLSRDLCADKGSKGAATAAGSGPDWVKRGARSGSTHALSAVAVSSDGALLAVGGGDRRVHVYDARTGGFVQAFPGHRWVHDCMKTLWHFMRLPMRRSKYPLHVSIACLRLPYHAPAHAPSVWSGGCTQRILYPPHALCSA